MHAYRRFVQDAMDQDNLRPADVHRKGGPSPQVLSRILNDSRDRLVQRPDQDTLEKLVDGLGVQLDALLAAVAEAMGLPVQISVAGLEQATDDQLLAEVRRRMRADHDVHEHPDQDRERAAQAERGGAGGGDAGAGQKNAAPAGVPADFDLAAHPHFELTRDRQDREWGDVGEESQDNGGDGA